jgi:hypothetical protein
MKRTARYFIHGHNTCSAERYHRERLKVTPKLFEFWVTWAPRCALNQLLHNDGYAETHRLVLAKLDQLPSWALDVEPGNQYVEAMDRDRSYHSARKSVPSYNTRQDQLAREFGKRRAEHDRASQSQGHEYQHTPPLFGDEEKKEKKEKRRRRTPKEKKADDDKAEAERTRLRGLYDAGDTTFTTLGVVDILKPKGKKGRKAKKAKGSRATGKENIDPRSEAHDATSAAAAAVLAAMQHASAPLTAPSAARAIAFR